MINIRINIKTFFLILLMLQAVKFTYSQDKSILDKKISLNIENKTLTEAIEIVSQKSNIYFSYNNQQIPEKTISFQADDKTIRYILNDLLKDTEVGFLV